MPLAPLFLQSVDGDDSCSECALRLLLSRSCRLRFSTRRRSKLPCRVTNLPDFTEFVSVGIFVWTPLFATAAGNEANEYCRVFGSRCFSFALHTHVKSSSQHVDSSEIQLRDFQSIFFRTIEFGKCLNGIRDGF